MIRRLFTIGSALSLLLCLGTVVLWVRGDSHCDSFMLQRSEQTPTPENVAPFTLQQVDQLRVALHWNQIWLADSLAIGGSRGRLFAAYWVEFWPMRGGKFRYADINWANEPFRTAKWNESWGVGYGSYDIGPTHFHGISVALWVVVSITAVLPIVWVGRYKRPLVRKAADPLSGWLESERSPRRRRVLLIAGTISLLLFLACAVLWIWDSLFWVNSVDLAEFSALGIVFQLSSWNGRFRVFVQWRVGRQYDGADVELSYAWCALITAIPPLALLGSRWWKRHRGHLNEPGLRCTVCGYDLRATRDRCPECGTPTKAEAKT